MQSISENDETIYDSKEIDDKESKSLSNVEKKRKIRQLAQLYKQVKQEHSLLKKHLKIEQEKTKRSNDMYEEKEKELRLSYEEIDRLAYANGVLTKRIERLQEELSSSVVSSASSIVSGANYLTSFFVNDTNSPNDQGNAVHVAHEELKVKINENEKIHMELFELKQQFEDETNKLQQDLDDQRNRSKELVNECVKKDESFKKLMTNKESLLCDIDRLQTYVASTEQDTKRNQNLMQKRNLDLSTALNKQIEQYNEKIAFDDSVNTAMNSWNVLNSRIGINKQYIIHIQKLRDNVNKVMSSFQRKTETQLNMLQHEILLFGNNTTNNNNNTNLDTASFEKSNHSKQKIYNLILDECIEFLPLRMRHFTAAGRYLNAGLTQVTTNGIFDDRSMQSLKKSLVEFIESESKMKSIQQKQDDMFCKLAVSVLKNLRKSSGSCVEDIKLRQIESKEYYTHYVAAYEGSLNSLSRLIDALLLHTDKHCDNTSSSKGVMTRILTQCSELKSFNSKSVSFEKQFIEWKLQIGTTIALHNDDKSKMIDHSHSLAFKSASERYLREFGEFSDHLNELFNQLPVILTQDTDRGWVATATPGMDSALSKLRIKSLNFLNNINSRPLSYDAVPLDIAAENEASLRNLQSRYRELRKLHESELKDHKVNITEVSNRCNKFKSEFEMECKNHQRTQMQLDGLKKKHKTISLKLQLCLSSNQSKDMNEVISKENADKEGDITHTQSDIIPQPATSETGSNETENKGVEESIGINENKSNLKSNECIDSNLNTTVTTTDNATSSGNIIAVGTSSDEDCVEPPETVLGEGEDTYYSYSVTVSNNLMIPCSDTTNGSSASSIDLNEEVVGRENQLRKYYENQMVLLSEKIQLLNSQCIETYSKYQKSSRNVRKLYAERQNQIEMLRKIKDLMQTSREENMSVKRNYETQLNTLSQHTVQVIEDATTQTKLYNKVLECEVKCEVCNQWNPIKWLVEESSFGAICIGGTHRCNFRLNN